VSDPDLGTALDDQRAIEQAEGMIMQWANVDADRARGMLVFVAQTSDIDLVVAARQLIDHIG
jgi:hypothetical protein